MIVLYVRMIAKKGAKSYPTVDEYAAAAGKGEIKHLRFADITE